MKTMNGKRPVNRSHPAQPHVKYVLIGGDRWRKQYSPRVSYDYVYFDNLEEFGLKTEPVVEAALGSRKLSRKEYSRGIAKVWVDVRTGKFAWKNIDDDSAASIVAEIQKRLAASLDS